MSEAFTHFSKCIFGFLFLFLFLETNKNTLYLKKSDRAADLKRIILYCTKTPKYTVDNHTVTQISVIVPNARVSIVCPVSHPSCLEYAGTFLLSESGGAETLSWHEL